MTEHLPECPVEKRLRAGRTVGSQTCICDALRICEERVQKISYAQGLGAGSDEHRQHEIGWVKGYAAALDAAWEAVAALPKGGMGLRAHELWRNALTAIDELREEDQP